MNTRNVRAVLFGVFWWFLFFWNSIYAANDLEIDISVLLQDEVLSNVDAGDRSKMVDSIVDGRDIFRSSLAFEKFKHAQTHAVALDKVYEHLTSYLPYCPDGVLYTKEKPEEDKASKIYLHPDPVTKTPVQIKLSKRDVVNVYTLSQQWTESLWLLNNDRVFEFADVKETDDSYLSSCKRVVGCQQWMAEIQYDGSRIENEEIPPTTVQERKDCQTIVSDLFDVYAVQVEASLEYDQNRDREVYYNNVLEEDRMQFCDINSEFEKIGKMLSSDTQDLVQFSSFDPQTVKKNSDTEEDEVRYPGEYESEPEDIPEESSFSTIIEDVPFSWVPDDLSKKEVTADYLWSSWNGKNVVGPSDSAWSSASRLLSKPTASWLASLITTPIDADPGRVWWIWAIQNPQCEVSEFELEEDDVDLLTESKDLTKTIREYGNDLNKNERISQVLANEALLTDLEEESHSFVDEPVISPWALEADLKNLLETKELVDDPEELNRIKEMEEDIKSCIDEFTDEDPESWVQQMRRFLSSSYEIRECIQEVLCQQITDPSWRGLYSIRFCSELEKGFVVPWVKKVSSMGDVFLAISDAIESINSSWARVDYQQATEALEWQIADLQFKDLFSFTVDVTMNGLSLTKDPKVEKALRQQELRETQQVILGEYDDLSILYPFVNDAVLYSEPQINALEQDFQIWLDFQWSADQANKIIEELDKKPADLHKYYERLNNYKQLSHGSAIMSDHTVFWKEMLQILEEMRDELEKHYKTME